MISKNCSKYSFELTPGPFETSVPLFQFTPVQSQTYYAEGLVVRVGLPSGRSWIGNFQRGVGSFTKIFAMPREGFICVIASGTAYVVSVEEPSKYEILSSGPITNVIETPQESQVIFVTNVDLIGFGATGFLWQSERLSWDGIKITNVSTEEIQGLAWDLSTQREVPFYVNIRNGAHKGGANIPENIRR